MIAVVVSSRNRARKLSAVLTTLDDLSSDKHEIAYYVRVDNDMPEMVLTAKRLATELPVYPVIDAPTFSAAKQYNSLLALEDVREADHIVLMTDDNYPITPGWDELVVKAGREHDLFFWNDTAQPGSRIYPVMSGRYLRAIGGFAEYFPFWFTDTWLVETHFLAFKEAPPIVENLQLAARRGQTMGLRDLPFWYEFFGFMRHERVREAGELAKAFGRELERSWLDRVLPLLEKTDAIQIAKAPHIEARMKGEATPDARYLAYKAAAESLMKVAA